MPDWSGNMTLDELRATTWWALWVAETGGYEPDDDAIKVALMPGLEVQIVKDSGDWYVLADPPDDPDGYSMACVPTRKEAVALSREMGWRVKR